MKQKIKIVIAPDSFKGSISARGAAEAIEQGLHEGTPAHIDLETVTLPIADGGEGTLDALIDDENRIAKTVTGTDGSPVLAHYGHLEETAVIEMAKAAGLTLVAEPKRNAATATTYGVGELLSDALDKGYRKILLTVGGSGTNDGGCGMFSALGAKFYNSEKREFIPTGGTLAEIVKIDLTGLDPRLSECKIQIATDVKNPLCGEHGATRVYARQKGADDASLDRMEAGMQQYARILSKMTQKNIADIPGCGAGGGLATPLLAFCNAEIRSGIRAVLEAVHFDDALKDANLVITGEGRIDLQSLYGKAISGVADAATKRNIPVVCFVGCVGDDPEKLKAMGIADICSLSDISPSIEYSLTHPDILLQQIAAQYMQKYF